MRPGEKIPSYKNLWFDPYAREREELGQFRRLVETFHDTPPDPLRPEAVGFYENVGLRHEFTSSKGGKIWAIPERHVWDTPLHTWCYIWDERTLIFLDGKIRRQNGPIQEEFPNELQFWLNAIDAIRAGEIIHIPGEGFKNSPDERLTDKPEPIILSKFVNADRTKEIFR